VGKRRIDVVLVERGFFETREQAQRALLAGEVLVGTRRVTKRAELLSADDEDAIVIAGRDHAVSRGYYKLQKAFLDFALEADGRAALDVGASTGGFTQYLLERGAHPVYAVDCGTNQLVYSLRRDARVIVLEKTNARFLTYDALARAWNEDLRAAKGALGGEICGTRDIGDSSTSRRETSPASNGETIEPQIPLPDLAVMDVSFISATLILPQLVREFPLREIALLVKPQFEAGREDVAKGGIVREASVHRRVLARIAAFARELDFPVRALTYSPIRGAEGNIEFLSLLCRNSPLPVIDEDAIAKIVAEAHEHL
jgi:23S rRNA (cytidine1920-2'-O)/16S rRNA (cytidine1409-2'-O)-methyltransferase